VNRNRILNISTMTITNNNIYIQFNVADINRVNSRINMANLTMTINIIRILVMLVVRVLLIAFVCILLALLPTVIVILIVIALLLLMCPALTDHIPAYPTPPGSPSPTPTPAHPPTTTPIRFRGWLGLSQPSPDPSLAAPGIPSPPNPTR